MLSQVKREIRSTAPTATADSRTPLVSYSAEKSLLMIQESQKRLDKNHIEAIKMIVADHLNSKSMLDIVLHLQVVDRKNLPFLFDLFKFCKGLTEWNRKIDIAWFLSDDELNMKRLANDFKELYDLNLRILSIS